MREGDGDEEGELEGERGGAGDEEGEGYEGGVREGD